MKPGGVDAQLDLRHNTEWVLSRCHGHHIYSSRGDGRNFCSESFLRFQPFLSSESEAVKAKIKGCSIKQLPPSTPTLLPLCPSNTCITVIVKLTNFSIFKGHFILELHSTEPLKFSLRFHIYTFFRQLSCLCHSFCSMIHHGKETMTVDEYNSCTMIDSSNII